MKTIIAALTLGMLSIGSLAHAEDAVKPSPAPVAAKTEKSTKSVSKHTSKKVVTPATGVATTPAPKAE